MATLVVYRADNLDNPAKLLTHFDDVQAELARVSLRLHHHPVEELSGAVGTLEHLPQALLLGLRALYPEHDWPHVELYARDAIPVYATASVETAEQEHCHPEAGLRYFLQGGGILCLRLADEVLALGCEPGDVIELPAGSRHWFSPRPGEDLLLVRLSASSAGLLVEPTGDPIARKIQLPDL
ncbi:hypothetical protein [Pseudomonas sp.]|uniref:hypothetical protein n=1 Tax=Pseudomonas sp. TaxID=306 RepID=UPI00272B82D4|nr:hypothetical protein [Pseudomonas sp.]